ILTAANIFLAEPKPILQTLGYKCSWINQSKTLVAEKQGMKLELQVGNINSKVNGKNVALQTAPAILNEKMFVPLESFLKAIEVDFDWDVQNDTILLLTDMNCRLYFAVLSDDNLAVEELIKRGANPNYVNYLGNSMLETAIPTGEFNTIDALIMNGADINSRDDDGDTMLQLAISFARPEIVQLLIDSGADLYAKNADGLDALGYATSRDEDNYYNKEAEIVYHIIRLIMENAVKI
ncbi:MAG TPA: ankyrin repeat domain-containing protein, partial [Negativicutes bacterium]|nr:ankyrin repeat domain-containing protein [Negativicutes bacterium]